MHSSQIQLLSRHPVELEPLAVPTHLLVQIDIKKGSFSVIKSIERERALPALTSRKIPTQKNSKMDALRTQRCEKKLSKILKRTRKGTK